MAGECPGVCNSLWRDVTARYKADLGRYDEAVAALAPGDPAPPRPEAPDVRPWQGDPAWCPACTSKITIRLGELDDLGPLLKSVRAGLHAAEDGSRVTGSREQPSPSSAADDVDEMVSMLAGWEGAYRDLKGWPSPPRRGYLAGQLTTVVAWLGEHLQGILGGPLAEDFGREVLQWHRELSARADAGGGAHRKPVRCPRCEMMLLTWREGDEYVACQNPSCQRMLSLDEYQEHAAAAARDAAA